MKAQRAKAVADRVLRGERQTPPPRLERGAPRVEPDGGAAPRDAHREARARGGGGAQPAARVGRGGVPWGRAVPEAAVLLVVLGVVGARGRHDALGNGWVWVG